MTTVTSGLMPLTAIVAQICTRLAEEKHKVLLLIFASCKKGSIWAPGVAAPPLGDGSPHLALVHVKVAHNVNVRTTIIRILPQQRQAFV